MICRTTHLATLAALLLPLVSATFNFNTFLDDKDVEGNYTVPTSWGISPPCIAAYATDIPCDDNILIGVVSNLHGASRSTCTNQCIDGLRNWRDGVRAKCSEDDITAVSSQLNVTGPTPQDVGGPNGAILLKYIADPKMPLIELFYFNLCTRDLKTNDLCEVGMGEDFAFPQENSTQQFNTTFCDNTCFTQYLVVATNIYQILYGSEDGSSGVTGVKDLCPGLDTSKYPVILSQEPVSSFSFDSSNPNANANANANNSTTKDEPTVPKPNAAVSLKGSLWGMGSTFVAVAIAVFVL